MLKGIIEEESFPDRSVLDLVEIVSSEKEKHFEDIECPVWTIDKVLIKEDYEGVLKKLSEGMEEEWNAFFWDDKYIYILFSNKIFKLANKDPLDPKEYKEVAEYALKEHYIGHDFWEGLRDKMNSW